MKVYLAGPITGLTYAEGEDWRDKVRVALADHGIIAYSPLRAKEWLNTMGKLSGGYANNPLTTERGIVERDRWDVMTSDLVLFNLLGAKAVSVGTCIEFGWADAWRKPIVVAIEVGGNLHEHPMISGITGFRVATLTEAVGTVVRILNP